jgi:hypothetical protein
MDKTKVLLLVACLALAGVVVWQQSSDVAMVTPQPLQLIQPAAPSAGNAVASAPLAPAAEPAAVAPAATPDTPAPKKTAPRPRQTAAASKAASIEHTETVAPAAPAHVAPVTAPAAASTSTEAYEAQAAARVQQGNYREAGELFETAVRNGGKATFTVVHDHSKGNFEKDPKASCVGELVFTTTDIRFDGVGAGESHHFEASWAEVIEAGSNKFFGSGIGGFHVAMSPDGKYKNINLAPKSKDKAEAKMIIDLLNSSARGKTDRGSK